MKKKHIYLGLGLLMAGGIALSSCTKNNDNTIVPIGTEYYIDDIFSVIPESLQTQFMDEFGNIYEGPVPPKIEGSYVLNSNTLVGTNQVITTPRPEPDFKLRFIKQHNAMMSMDLYDGSAQTTDTVFVMGKDEGFTAYCIEEKMVEALNYQVKSGIVMRGKMSDEGIVDFRMAIIVMDVTGEGQDNAPTIGSYYIYEENDGLASCQEW